MKAACWVGLGQVVCADVPVPLVAEGEILVRTAYTSICGSDLHRVFGGAPGETEAIAPGHPGHESVGEVVESRSAGFAPGDYVLAVPPMSVARGLAEYQAVRASSCVRLPAGIPLSHLLMAQQLGTVVYALRVHPLDLVGRDVAVIGQGSAGAFFTFLLKRAEPGLESFRYAVRLIADGAIDVGPLLSHQLPIEEVGAAFRIAHDRADGALKVSIKF